MVTRRELLDAVLEDEPRVAGDPFDEPAGIEVPHFDNAFTSEPAIFLACYLLPPRETRLIEMLPRLT